MLSELLVILLLQCTSVTSHQQQLKSKGCPAIPPRTELKDIHRSRTKRRTVAMEPSPLVQVSHPMPPEEKQWLMVAGNETQVDIVLAQSLSFGGRLVSIGFFTSLGSPHYYAIMHKYPGPVFIKPAPMTYEQLLKAVRDNELRDMALTQVCGQELEGKLTFMTYWEYVPGIRQQIWFPGTPSADEQRKQYESTGHRLTYLCGFTVKGHPKYVGVWQRRGTPAEAYEAHYGLPLQACLGKNALLASRQYVARHFAVFQMGPQLLCTGIWEYAPSHRHFIRVGTNLQMMHSEFMAEKRVIPRQMSHYLSGPKTVQYVVLWSDLHSDRFPNPSPLWNRTSNAFIALNPSPTSRLNVIPAEFVPGSAQLLTPTQFSFAVQRIESLMKQYDLPGLSIAIAKHERLKFAAGFGYADLRQGLPVKPSSLFRIGSVSKPITASAVFLLVDRGLLDIDNPVFGEGKLFGLDYAMDGKYGLHVDKVSVRHLLEHSVGGWDNEEGDCAWSRPKADILTVIKENLALDLAAPPGGKWVYSNFGYLLLGLVIEKLSGVSYEQFVHDALLAPSGAPRTFVARPTIDLKAPDEVVYYMSGTSIGFDPYEMLVPERIGPWGGWVASPVQLLKFLAAVDGSNVRPDLLSKRAVIEIATPTAISNETYGLGWSINVMGFNGWQHDGRMPGASAMLVRLASGHSMAVTTNKEFTEREFFHDMAYMLHHLVHQCDWWNDATDLFLFT